MPGLNGIDFSSALAPWRRRSGVIAAVFAVTLAGAVGAALWLPDLYQATATILIERPQVPESVVRSAVTSDLETRLQTIREQITSRARLLDVIERHQLYPELRDTASPDAIVNRMRRDLSVEMKGVENRSEPGSTITLAVGYRGRSPQTVAAVANTLANEYVQENSRTRERHARGTSEFLKSQLDQAKRQLDAQEARINSFRMRHGRELPSGREAALSALERMASDLDRNSDAQMRIKERIAMIDTGLAIPAAPPRPDGSESDEARASRLRAQLGELRQRYTDQYPDVVAVREELEQVQRRLRQSSGSATAPTPSAARAEALRKQLEADLERLREQEKELKPSLMTYQSRLERMSGRDIELEQLSRDYLSTREQYDSLLKKYSDAALAERVELRSNGEEFSILDRAIPPAEPAAPNRLRLLIMAVVFAAGLTFAVALLMHWLDGSLHTVDDLRALTAVPIIGTVPPIVTSGDRARGVLRTSLATIAVVVAVAAAFGGASVLASGNESLVRLFSRGAS